MCVCCVVCVGQTKLLPFMAACLGAGLHCISDTEEEIRVKAEATNNTLLALVEQTQVAFYPAVPLSLWSSRLEGMRRMENEREGERRMFCSV